MCQKRKIEMPFKLIAIIDSSLSLGSVLMTSDVHVISIENVEKSNAEVKIFLPKSSSVKFHHPSGKTVKEFIKEYMVENKVGKWKDLQTHATKQGFKRASINNSIERLLKAGFMTRVSSGQYAIQKNHE
jgi:hypothetical protein